MNIQPIRKGDKFQLEDGTWEVLGLAGPFVDLQCSELSMQIRYPATVVRTWTRVS